MPRQGNLAGRSAFPGKFKNGTPDEASRIYKHALAGEFSLPLNSILVILEMGLPKRLWGKLVSYGHSAASGSQPRPASNMPGLRINSPRQALREIAHLRVAEVQGLPARARHRRRHPGLGPADHAPGRLLLTAAVAWLVMFEP